MRSPYRSAAGLIVVLALQVSSGDAVADVVWHDSYSAARELAETTGKPLLVQFR